MNSEVHLSLDEIAQLAEGHVSSESARAAVPHLARCRTCMAAYVDAVRYRAAWLAQPEMFELPPGHVESMAAASAHRKPPTREPVRRRRLLQFAPLALASLLAALFWPRGSAEPELPRNIARALTAPGSGLALPGAVSPEPATEPILRGQDPRHDSDSLFPPIPSEALRAPGPAYQLGVARLAAGDISGARLLCTRALTAFPDDRSLLFLSAAIAFRNSDLPHGIHIMDRLLERDPGDRLAQLDLALLRRESGDTASAGRILRALSRSGDAIGDRARAEVRHRRHSG